MSWLGRWFRRRQRAIDMHMLWPEIESQFENRSVAVAMFGGVILEDPAWTTDYCDEALYWMLDCLEKQV